MGAGSPPEREVGLSCKEGYKERRHRQGKPPGGVPECFSRIGTGSHHSSESCLCLITGGSWAPLPFLPQGLAALSCGRGQGLLEKPLLPLVARSPQALCAVLFPSNTALGGRCQKKNPDSLWAISSAAEQ